LSEDLVVSIPSGGCVDCSNCGLCGKKVKENMSVVLEAGKNISPAATDGTAEGSPIQEIPTVVAVDLGTTTVGMYLVNALTGEQLGVFVALNPQELHGSDVISRIASAEKGHKEELQKLIIDLIERGVAKVATKGKPEMIVISGNTVMGYLLMGYDTSSLGVYPFKMEHTGKMETVIAGIKTVLLPGISAFVGGDALAGMYSLDFHKKEEVSLLVDLGTNAEMVLGNKDKILATAAAAGPAFDQKVYGAQLISGVATLLKEGKMDSTGCLEDAYFESGATVGRMLITRQEIRGLQVAKAAVAAGIGLLLDEYGISAGEVDKVYLAGGLGFYLDLDAALAIKLFPEEFRNKIEVVGNTSLAGAHRYATAYKRDEAVPEKELEELIGKTEEMNLAELPGFQEKFLSSMNF